MRTVLNKQFLVNNLCWFYRLMVASAPLLDFAQRWAEGSLWEYYEKHFKEEWGHDKMLAEDLRTLGVTKIPCSMSAATLAGRQYYLIAHHHPAMLLGYMQALESQPMSLDTIQELELTHDCKLSALRHHAKHDPAHAAELEIQIVSLPPSLLQDVLSNRNATNLAIEAEVTLWQREQNG